MRYFEISGGFQVPLSEEEQGILSRAEKTGALPRATLDERECEVARLMVQRGLLNRRRRNDEIFYEPNRIDAWRF